MKRSELLVRHEVTEAILTAAKDTMENFELTKQAIEIIKDEDLDGWTIGYLRAAGAHLIDAIEAFMASFEQDDLPSEDQRQEAMQKMRDDLARAGEPA